MAEKVERRGKNPFYERIRFERFIELIGDRNGRLLDLGCAEGVFASFLGDGYDYHGVEVSSKKIATARRRGLNVICHDLNHGIPFPDGYFDVVVAGELIEHMPNVSSFLAEVNRVLKPSGIFVGSTPNAASPSHYILDEIINPMLLSRGKMGGRFGHLYVFSRAQLRALFELNGMRITEFTGNTLLPVSKLTMRLNRWLGRKLSHLSTCLVFRAEKVKR